VRKSIRAKSCKFLFAGTGPNSGRLRSCLGGMEIDIALGNFAEAARGASRLCEQHLLLEALLTRSSLAEKASN